MVLVVKHILYNMGGGSCADNFAYKFSTLADLAMVSDHLQINMTAIGRRKSESYLLENN